MKKTLLLTGATGKFGQVLTRFFAETDWTVIATSRDQSRADDLAASINSEQSRVIGIAADFQQPDASQRLINELAQRKIEVTHLINNARSLDTLEVKADGTTQREVFMDEFALDVVTPYELSMSLARSEEHTLKSIVNIGSMYGEIAPNPALYENSLDRSPVQYGVSKAALHHLTRELAVRLAPQNIRVNCVAYGGVDGRVDQAFRKRYAQLVPSGRMLNESEIAGPVNFLLDESSSAVNGHVLIADGGWSVW